MMQLYIEKGIVNLDSWKSLGIDMGLIGGIIGFMSALFKIFVNKLKPLSL